jgi:hexokinase
MKHVVSAFLSRHSFPVSLDIESCISALRCDMQAGLTGGPLPASQDMIRTWALPPEQHPAGTSVIVIDAGGTNFRSCLVTFDADGVPTISSVEKQKMPGTEGELSKKQFFDKIAVYLEHLKDQASSISFCFSYPMEITRDGDGIPSAFSKEIKAPEVVGCHMGKTLSETLAAHGWKKIKRITLLNDTVAALLAGAAGGSAGVSYSSYVGFILGTGMNTAYIQPAISGDRPVDEQIIVCESGKFDKIVRSDFDRAVDSRTARPGAYLTEKCCSGAYLNQVAAEVLAAAAHENMLSPSCSAALLQLEKITLMDIDAFLYSPYRTDTVLGAVLHRGVPEDYGIVFELLDAVIERAARYSAAILAAAVIESGKGTDASRPVCLLCNGTTFYKTHHLRTYVEGFLDDVLVRSRGLHYEIVTRENDIALGTAVAGIAQ